MMQAFYQPLNELNSFEQLNIHVDYHPGVVMATGCIDAQKAHVVSGLKSQKAIKLLIAHDEQKARELLAECQFFFPDAVYFQAKGLLCLHVLTICIVKLSIFFLNHFYTSL